MFPPEVVGGSLRPVMEEIDIWRTAALLIRTLGFDGAAFEASHKAKAMREKGDLEGDRVWKLIEEKIEELKGSWYVPDATKH